jgi:hypothetical protein
MVFSGSLIFPLPVYGERVAGRKRRPGEGQLLRMKVSENRLKNAISIVKDIIVPKAKNAVASSVPKAKNAVASSLQFLVTSTVAETVSVLSAIGFDDELSFAANEICDVASYRFLSYEFETVEPTVA